jgi:uncharacterized protein
MVKLPIMKQPLPVKKLQDLGVGLVYLFGSYAEEVAGPGSDVDVAVVMNDPRIAQGSTGELYNTLFDIFSDVFDLSDFKTIDIVFLDKAPLELSFDVITHGAILYETSSDARLDFEERIEARYRDFYPILQEFNRAILERV